MGKAAAEAAAIRVTLDPTRNGGSVPGELAIAAALGQLRGLVAMDRADQLAIDRSSHDLMQQLDAARRR